MNLFTILLIVSIVSIILLFVVLLNPPAIPQNTYDSKKIFKYSAKMSWKISQMQHGHVAKNKYNGDSVTFAPHIIDNAKDFVKHQEENNPEWVAWVAEWTREQNKA